MAYQNKVRQGLSNSRCTACLRSNIVKRNWNRMFYTRHLGVWLNSIFEPGLCIRNPVVDVNTVKTLIAAALK